MVIGSKLAWHEKNFRTLTGTGKLVPLSTFHPPLLFLLSTSVSYSRFSFLSILSASFVSPQCVFLPNVSFFHPLVPLSFLFSIPIHLFCFPFESFPYPLVPPSLIQQCPKTFRLFWRLLVQHRIFPISLVCVVPVIQTHFLAPPPHCQLRIRHR